MEELDDATDIASSCMVEDVKEAFYDPDCKEPIFSRDPNEQDVVRMRAQRLIARGNQIIQSKECEQIDHT